MLLYGEVSSSMPLELLPFPRYHRLSFGSVVGSLPITREGIRNLPANSFPGTSHNCYAHIRISRHPNGQESRGIGGLMHHSAFLDGSVRPHEKTLVSRLKRQEELVLPDQGALGKPILLTVPSLAAWWAKQDQHLDVSGACLQLVGQENSYTLRDFHFKSWHYEPGPPPKSISLADLGTTVIADGHHRAETHARLGAAGVPGFEYVPVCIIGADELQIGVFARIITAECVGGNLMQALERFFIITPIATPAAPKQVGEWLLCRKRKYFRLHCKVNPAALTDVEWLNAIFLPQCYGITDVRTDDRITFDPIDDPVDGLIKDNFPESATTLICHPLPRERFFTKVQAGQVLPPKSTRFEPRIPSGLIVWVP